MKVFLEVKKLLKLRFLDYFLKAEMEECNQEHWSVNIHWSRFGVRGQDFDRSQILVTSGGFRDFKGGF